MRRRFRVRVRRNGDQARIVVTKAWVSLYDDVLVQRLDLVADDAEQQIADARARAQQIAADLTALERS